MTKEEFNKQVKRYFDMFNKDLCCEPYDIFGIMEEFEKWAKEHPAITNKEKFEQIFGIKVTPADCPPASTGRCDRFISCDAFGDCDECRKWWGEEYKEPNGEVTG